MPITLSTLFTTPQDIWDVLSVEGVDLRLDDHNLASGQLITTIADAIVGATSISVVALPVALLKGAQLTFDGASLEVPITVTLTAAASLGATSLSVTALEYQVNAGAEARDNGVNASTGARLLVAARKGTSEVKLFCNQRYDDSQLVLSGSVLDWATTIACRWLAKRRLQGCPAGLESDYKDVIARLQMVQYDQLSIEDIGTRGTDWPTISNITVNPAYDTIRARVQPSISEGSTTGYNQHIDWNSAAMLEF